MLKQLQAADINRCPTILPEIINSAKEVYTDIQGTARRSLFKRYFSGTPTTRVDGFQKLLENSNVKPLRPLVNRLRVTKSEAEIINMRKAGQISGRVYGEAMKTPLDTEKDLWTMLDCGFRMGGLDGCAYVPVVAGGKVGAE